MNSTMAAEHVAILAKQVVEFRNRTTLLKSLFANIYGQEVGCWAPETNSSATFDMEQLRTSLSYHLAYNEDIVQKLRLLVHMVVNELMPTIRWHCWELNDVIPPMADVQQWYSQLADIILDFKEIMGKVRQAEIPPIFQSVWCERTTRLFQELTNCDNLLMANPIAVSNQPGDIVTTTKLSPIQVTPLCGNRSSAPEVKSKMKVILINEVQARKVYELGFPNGIKMDHKGKIYESYGTMKNNSTTLSPRGAWEFPKLSIMKVQRRKPSGSDSVLEEKCCFLIYAKKPLDNNRVWWCCSRPFFVTVHISQSPKVVLWAFIEESFRARNRLPFEVPESVPCSKVIAALEKYFMRMTNCQRGFTPTNRAFLRLKLLKYAQVRPDQDPLINTNRFDNKEEGCSFTFFQWFTGIIEVVNVHLESYWKGGFIVGFIDRLSTEGLLAGDAEDGGFIVRFSESVLSAITVSYVLKIGTESITASLEPFTCQHLKSLSLSKILQGRIHQQALTRVYFHELKDGLEKLESKPKSEAFPPSLPAAPEDEKEKEKASRRFRYVPWGICKFLVANLNETKNGQHALSSPGELSVANSPLVAGSSSGELSAASSPDQVSVASSPGHSSTPSSPGQYSVPGSQSQFIFPSNPGQFSVPSSHSPFLVPISPGQYSVRSRPGQFHTPGSPFQYSVPGSHGLSLFPSSPGQIPAPSSPEQLRVPSSSYQFPVPSSPVSIHIPMSPGQIYVQSNPDLGELDLPRSPLATDPQPGCSSYPIDLNAIPDVLDLDQYLSCACSTTNEPSPASCDFSSCPEYNLDADGHSVCNLAHELRMSVEMELGF